MEPYAHPARFVGVGARLRRGQLTAATAARITSATACGWEIITTCDASTSVTWAPLRAAIALAPVGPIALSAVPTTAQDGSVFHAGFVVGSPNPTSAAGRCETAITAGCSSGRSAQNTSWNEAGSMMNSVPGSPPPVGYWAGRSAAPS